MGKAGRWLRSFFVTGRKAKDRDKQDDADAQSVSSAAPPAREKRRWSFRRPAAAVACRVEAGASGLGPTSSQCFSEAEVRVVLVQEREQQAVAVAVPEAAIATAATVVPLSPPASETTERSCGRGDAEADAATKIQSAFRSYLARKALCALRGMVKLQAMVRAQLVRRQANTTLRRMQALVDAQRRARDERLRLLEDDGSGRRLATTATTTPRPPTRSRRSPQHHQRSRMSLEVVERSSEENVKILEVDDGGDADGARRGGSCCYSTPPSRTPAKAELYLKVSPTPSALTDASARTLSGRFDDASLASASEPPCRRKAWRDAPAIPSYMANTESSRAKARRSQSAPRQRLAAASESGASVAATAASPSCGERPPPGWNGGGARRRASLDPLDLLGARAAAAATGRVERCASRALPAGRV